MRYAVTRDSTLLQRAGQDVTTAYTGAGLSIGAVNSTELVIVTWTDLRSAADQNAVSKYVQLCTCNVANITA